MGYNPTFDTIMHAHMTFDYLKFKHFFFNKQYVANDSATIKTALLMYEVITDGRDRKISNFKNYLLIVQILILEERNTAKYYHP